MGSFRWLLTWGSTDAGGGGGAEAAPVQQDRAGAGPLQPRAPKGAPPLPQSTHSSVLDARIKSMLDTRFKTNSSVLDTPIKNEGALRVVKRG